MNQTLKFGHTPDGESISWHLIEKADEKLLLLAQNGIDVFPFVNLQSNQNANQLHRCFFEDSDLKHWLNEQFLDQCFEKDKKKNIHSISIPCANDIEQWFLTEHERICFPTQYALDHGAAVFQCAVSERKSCVYWLSDTGRKAGFSASVVLANGKIYKSAYMAADNVCVRPLIEVSKKEFPL